MAWGDTPDMARAENAGTDGPREVRLSAMQVFSYPEKRLPALRGSLPGFSFSGDGFAQGREGASRGPSFTH